jgi:hypothetical protein
MRLVILFYAALSAHAAEFPQLPVNPQLNPLPPEALAFPEFSEHYRQKIISGNYEIWSEEKLQRWSSAQGLTVSGDHGGAALQYHRAAVISAPGLSFILTRPVTEKGSEFANGWKLNLDIAAIRPRDGSQLKKGSQYNNLLECDVYIDDVFYLRLRQGSQNLTTSPVQIQIPHIRSAEGKVNVELRLANHPRNFLFLYDAYLSR